jgi:hypothetical protein
MFVEKWKFTSKRMELDRYLIQYTKINSEWIKDLNKRCEMIHLIGEKFHDIILGSDFLDMSSSA